MNEAIDDEHDFTEAAAGPRGQAGLQKALDAIHAAQGEPHQIRLPVEVWDRLTEKACERETSRNALLREIVLAWFDAQP